MNHGNPDFSLRCNRCGQRQTWSVREATAILRDLGFLRREGEPSAELAMELAAGALEAGRWPACAACGENAYGVDESVNEAELADWGDARHCEKCGVVIPPERLELFPDSRRCARCQSESSTESDREFCPQCGSVLELKAVRRPGATYRMHCPACRKTF